MRPVKIIPQVISHPDSEAYTIRIDSDTTVEFAKKDGNELVVATTDREFLIKYDERRKDDPLVIRQSTASRSISYDMDGHCQYAEVYAQWHDAYLCGHNPNPDQAIPAILSMGDGVVPITQRSFRLVHLPDELRGDAYDALVYSNFNSEWVRVPSEALVVSGRGPCRTAYSPDGRIIASTMHDFGNLDRFLPEGADAYTIREEAYLGQYL